MQSESIRKSVKHKFYFDNNTFDSNDEILFYKRLKDMDVDFDGKYLDYPEWTQANANKDSQLGLPDLIITDGGKGQMEVVREVIEDELHLQIPIAGLAKDGKHRTSEVLYGFPPLSIGIKQGTPLFHLLENIQNEVHRFAITFHRDKRSKSQIASALDNIPGIGEKRKNALLKNFRSVSRIKQATLEEIAAVVGMQCAKNIKEKLQ